MQPPETILVSVDEPPTLIEGKLPFKGAAPLGSNGAEQNA